jgi:predicted TIM-barrel fold metal-dependent hydrolase
VYGLDNSAILDALATIGANGRAVVALDMSVTDTMLSALDRRGVRGVRLNLDNKGGMPVDLSDVPILANRIAKLGWHFEFLFRGPDMERLAPMICSLPVPVSIGHFGYMPALEGVDYPPFRVLIDLVKTGNVWVKLSAPNRLGVGDLAPWHEVVPLAQRLIAANPERMLWGTDWPHPNKFSAQPDDADLIDQLALWTPDPAIQRQILVDNPEALYGF